MWSGHSNLQIVYQSRELPPEPFTVYLEGPDLVRQITLAYGHLAATGHVALVRPKCQAITLKCDLCTLSCS